MLMSRMVRLRIGLLIAFAALLAAEPIIHNHPLIPDGSAAVQSLCAVCASGADRVVLSAPTVVAPTFVAYALEVASVEFVFRPAALPRASRAPPAA